VCEWRGGGEILKEKCKSFEGNLKMGILKEILKEIWKNWDF
jgi:hypothetical protein